MTKKTLKKVLSQANKNNYAVAGLVVLGWEDALAYTQASDETGIPIILQAGPGCRKYTPISILGKMFHYLAEQTKSHIVCHIDHGYSFEECLEGIDNGFTSVMFDGSKLPIKENIKLTSTIVKKAHTANVSVEGEVGFVGYNRGKLSEGTRISEVELFANETGVDAIAISVGNTHLQTKKIAKIDFDKIKQIENVTNTWDVHADASGSYCPPKTIQNVANKQHETRMRVRGEAATYCPPKTIQNAANT